jgi:hypothetical protein
MGLQKRPQAKTSIWAGGDPGVCAVLPHKSAHQVAPAQIAYRKSAGPFGAPKAEKFILPEMFFGLLAHSYK